MTSGRGLSPDRIKGGKAVPFTTGPASGCRVGRRPTGDTGAERFSLPGNQHKRDAIVDHRQRPQREICGRAAESGAPSCDSLTKPSMAAVLGTSSDSNLMAGGMASLGQENPAIMNSGSPTAAIASCTASPVRKMPRDHHAEPGDRQHKRNGEEQQRQNASKPRQAVKIRQRDQIGGQDDRLKRQIGQQFPAQSPAGMRSATADRCRRDGRRTRCRAGRHRSKASAATEARRPPEERQVA